MRAERGSVRGLLLGCLIAGPAHGYQLIRQIEQYSGGAWSPSPGSVYPALMQLEDEGLVTQSSTGDKKVYTLTAAGELEAVVAAEAPKPWEPPPAAAGPRHSLRDVTHAAHSAARQVGTEGSPAQIEKAITIMRSARQQLYQLLAED